MALVSQSHKMAGASGLRAAALRSGVKPFGNGRAPRIVRRAAEEEAAAPEAAEAATVVDTATFSFNLNE